MVVCGVLVACGKEQPADNQKVNMQNAEQKIEGAAETSVPSASRNRVLAKVNGSEITADQMDIVIEKTLGENALSVMNEEMEQKILDSMVASRAMALLAEQDLNMNEREQLDLKVAAYREELLVKDYLMAQTTPKPVTNQMVKDYYAAHPEKFGGAVRKQVDYLEIGKGFGEDKRAVLYKTLGALTATSDWQQASKKLEGEGFSVNQVSATINPALTDEPLKSLVAKTPIGEVSPVKIDNNIYILRVNNEEKVPAKPLAEVSADIRKALAPVQLKKAVKEVSDKALEQMQVEYVE